MQCLHCFGKLDDIETRLMGSKLMVSLDTNAYGDGNGVEYALLTQYSKGALLIVLSAAGFALIPIFAVYAYQGGASVTTLLVIRFVIATLLFFAYLSIRRKGWKVTKRQLLFLFLLGGVFYTLQSSFYFSSVKYIPASLAALLLYTFPIFVTLLAVIVDKERLSKHTVLSIGVSLLGIAMVLGAPRGTINGVGVLLALGAALVYSGYIVMGNRVVATVPSNVTSAFISLFASLSLLIIGVTTHSLDFRLTFTAWLAGVGVALFSTFIAMIAFFSGVRSIGPTQSSVLSMLEPVITILFTTLLFQEHLTWLQILGGAIVLSGAVSIILFREKSTHQIEIVQSKKAC